jgi:hypothetical protein
MKFSKEGLDIKKIRWPELTLILIAVICFWQMYSVRLKNDSYRYVIASDGAGYYAYLPAGIIYQDFKYEFADGRTDKKINAFGAELSFFCSRTNEGKLINKYFLGTSLLMLPFFLLAILFSWLFGYPIDGYSYLFQTTICLSGIFYLLVGLWFLRKLLSRLQIRDKIISLVLLTLFLGTNLFHYTVEEPSMSHVYSFATIAFFLYHSIAFLQDTQKRNLIWACISLVLICFIRPTNMVTVLLIPFLFSICDRPLSFIREHVRIKNLLIPFGVALLLLFMQLGTYKLSVDHWYADSYNGEGFNFLKPHVREVLFGFRKGLFIYAPVLLLSIIGLFFFPKRKNILFLLPYVLINLWIISSWGDWGYGGCLGLRPYIDSYAVFAIPIAFLLQAVTNRIATFVTGSAIVFFLALNLTQHYQYHRNILPYDMMDFQKYSRLFFDIDPKLCGIYSPEPWLQGILPKDCKEIFKVKRNFDTDSAHWNQRGVVRNKLNFSEPGAVRMDDSINMSADIFVPIRGVIPDSLLDRAWVKVKAKVWLADKHSDSKMVFSFLDDKTNYSWNGYFIIQRVSESKSWQDYEFAMKVQKPQTGNGQLAVFVLTDDKQLMYVDDLELSYWIEPTVVKW